MLNRDEWKKLAAGAQLDKRVIAAILLGEPVRPATRRLVEYAASAEGISLPPDFWPAEQHDAIEGA